MHMHITLPPPACACVPPNPPVCLPGFGISADSGECVICAKGTYCAGGIPDLVCENCPFGTTAKEGATSWQDCALPNGTGEPAPERVVGGARQQQHVRCWALRARLRVGNTRHIHVLPLLLTLRMALWAAQPPSVCGVRSPPAVSVAQLTSVCLVTLFAPCPFKSHAALTCQAMPQLAPCKTPEGKPGICMSGTCKGERRRGFGQQGIACAHQVSGPQQQGCSPSAAGARGLRCLLWLGCLPFPRMLLTAGLGGFVGRASCFMHRCRLGVGGLTSRQASTPAARRHA